MNCNAIFFFFFCGSAYSDTVTHDDVIEKNELNKVSNERLNFNIEI